MIRMTMKYSNIICVCLLLSYPTVLVTSLLSKRFPICIQQYRQHTLPSCNILYSSKFKEQSKLWKSDSEPLLNEKLEIKNNRERSNLNLEIINDNDILPAIKAVRKACSVTHTLQRILCPKSSSLAKEDSSPVTIADYAAQAIVLDNLRTYFPADVYLAEESSKELLSQCEIESTNILQQIVQVVQSSNGARCDLEYILESIDLGQSFYDDDKNERIWCLDPIDGTKGFLRGVDNGQYCVALCLIVNGTPEVGILGCPNLNTNKENEGQETKNEKGCMFIAKRNQGCYQIPLCLNDDGNEMTNENWIADIIPNTIKRISATKCDESEMDLQDAVFCIGVEKYSDPSGQCDKMATLIHGPDAINEEDGSIVKAIRMDSQAKYGLLARGEAQVYLRLPKSGYVEWIWDHAAGSIIIQEAGGEITCVDGNPLDFSLGPKLSPNVKGIIGTNGGIFHDAILNAYHTQRKDRKSYK